VPIDIEALLQDKDPAALGNNIPDEVRNKSPEQLRELVEILDAHLRSLHQADTGELRDLTPDEDKAFQYGLKVREHSLKRIEEHRALSEVFSRRPEAVKTVYTNLRNGIDARDGVVRLRNSEARDAALRVLDDRSAASHLRSDEKDEIERQVRKSTDIARRIIVTENDAYRDAFMKMSTDPHGALMLTDEERGAMQAWAEYRAMSEGTTTAGGFGIPVFIDPSIILTAQGTNNPFLTLAKQVDVNTNIWKGVSSAGVSWAFQAEAATVADNSPTLAQPTVTVYMARGFIPYSIEVQQDYPGFASEMQTLLASGYNELLVDKFTRGAGTTEPNGIVTQLSANSSVRVALTTGGTFDAAAPYNTWKALPQRFRNPANWLMSVGVNNAIRQLATANVYHAFTQALPAEWADSLFGKRVYESPYMNDTTTSTSATTELAIVGDWQNYVVARRGGMNVELVPTLFDVTNNRPTGSRGWFAYARIGGNSVNDLGFRMLVNH
jgi:Predicted phage phi-C31 gp36 major capsid-like protein